MFCYLLVLAFFASPPVLTAVYPDRVHLCSTNEFSCSDGACVSLDRRCDGTQDCADGSDEATCARSSNRLDLHKIVLHRNRRQSGCRKNQWRCRDDTCIPFDGKCDGVVDCPDGSDETHALCRHMRCQTNLFRCTYGACVDGTAPCNGEKECADGSDELVPQCQSETTVTKGKFSCKSGEKISSADLCDGVKNCADGSDETLEACAGRRCAPYLFQCAYGACVDADAECDAERIQHCADGSDETDELCNRTSNSPSPSNRCLLPAFPEHGSYTVEGKPSARPGQVFDSVTLSVTCEPPYRPEGTTQPHCSNGQWYAKVPECKRFCKLNKHPSVTYLCKPTDPTILSGNRICNEYEPSGTEVMPKCNENYHSGVLAYMNCIDGSWDYTATCEPGTDKTTNVTVVVNDHVVVYVSGSKYSVVVHDPSNTTRIVAVDVGSHGTNVSGTNVSFPINANASVPVNTSVSVPINNGVSAPDKTDVSVPINTGVSATDKTDVSVPINTGVSAPDKTDVSVPIKTGVSVPGNSDVFVPINTDVYVPINTLGTTTHSPDYDIDQDMWRFTEGDIDKQTLLDRFSEIKESYLSNNCIKDVENQ